MAVDTDLQVARRTNLVVVLVGSVHRGVVDAVQYARSMAPERLIAVSVVTDDDEQERARRDVGRDGDADPAAHDRARPTAS